jgi:hypothetical protein
MLCLDDRDEMTFFFTKNVDYNKFFHCAGSTTLSNSYFVVHVVLHFQIDTTLVLMYLQQLHCCHLLGLLDVHSSDMLCVYYGVYGNYVSEQDNNC